MRITETTTLTALINSLTAPARKAATGRVSEIELKGNNAIERQREPRALGANHKQRLQEALVNLMVNEMTILGPGASGPSQEDARQIAQKAVDDVFKQPQQPRIDDLRTLRDQASMHIKRTPAQETAEEDQRDARRCAVRACDRVTSALCAVGHGGLFVARKLNELVPGPAAILGMPAGVYRYMTARGPTALSMSYVNAVKENSPNPPTLVNAETVRKQLADILQGKVSRLSPQTIEDMLFSVHSDGACATEAVKQVYWAIDNIPEANADKWDAIACVLLHVQPAALQHVVLTKDELVKLRYGASNMLGICFPGKSLASSTLEAFLGLADYDSDKIAAKYKHISAYASGSGAKHVSQWHDALVSLVVGNIRFEAFVNSEAAGDQRYNGTPMHVLASFMGILNPRLGITSNPDPVPLESKVEDVAGEAIGETNAAGEIARVPHEAEAAGAAPVPASAGTAGPSRLRRRKPHLQATPVPTPADPLKPEHATARISHQEENRIAKALRKAHENGHGRPQRIWLTPWKERQIKNMHQVESAMEAIRATELRGSGDHKKYRHDGTGLLFEFNHDGIEKVRQYGGEGMLNDRMARCWNFEMAALARKKKQPH